MFSFGIYDTCTSCWWDQMYGEYSLAEVIKKGRVLTMTPIVLVIKYNSVSIDFHSYLLRTTKLLCCFDLGLRRLWDNWCEFPPVTPSWDPWFKPVLSSVQTHCQQFSLLILVGRSWGIGSNRISIDLSKPLFIPKSNILIILFTI